MRPPEALLGNSSASATTSLSPSSLSSRLLNPIVASRTKKTSYPARLISPIAAAMRSESDSDSLIAFPSSCISSFNLSSKKPPFPEGHLQVNTHLADGERYRSHYQGPDSPYAIA